MDITNILIILFCNIVLNIAKYKNRFAMMF